MTTITTLIPAYKKDYLAEVFWGLARQTFKDFRVILSDDSPDAEITRLIRDGHFAGPLAKLNLTVVRGPCNARRNHEQLLELWAGQTPLVHFHLDDDIIYPDFYRSHATAHGRAPCGVSVSRRWLSGSDGRPALELPIPDAIAQRNERIVDVGSETLFATTAAVCENWLGELSNMVLSADAARLYPMPPLNGLSYYALLDIGLVLEVSRHLPVVFIQDHLGVFRQHAEQTTTRNRHTHGGRVAFLAWVTYALAAWREHRISAQQAVNAVQIASRRILQHFADDEVMAVYFGLLERHAADLDQLHAAYTRFWNQLLASNDATRPFAAAAPAEATAEPA
ncbi:MAG: glycosyltransferase family A protein [Pseudomonadota bacterium]